MQRFLKIVYWTSILLICFWVLTAISGNLIPLEFADNDSEFIYDYIRFYGLPIAIMLTLTGTLKGKDPSFIIAAKIFLTLCIAGLSILFVFMSLITSMCDWTTHEVFFESRQNPSIRIVQRSYGCGATDSSPATYSLFKVRELSPYLIWVTKADTNQINKDEWRRVESVKQ